MSRRAVVAAVAGWATVVGVTSAVAWVAIDRAGREVLTATSDVHLGAGAAATGSARTPRAVARPTEPTTAPTTARPSTTRPGSTTSVQPSAAARTRTASAPRATRSAPRTTVAAPSAVDRSVRVEGGQVGVRCVASTATLRFAQPADGWAVRVGDDGPESVTVTFRSSDDGRELEVEAVCISGTPVFSTSQSSSDGGSGENDASGDG